MEIIKLDITKQNEYSIKKIKNHICSHKLIEVDIEDKLVRCQSCNSIVDPFDFITQLATTSENHISYEKYLKFEIDQLTNYKERLEKNINNLKSKESRQKIDAKQFLKDLLKKEKWDGRIYYGNNGEYSIDVSYVCEEYLKKVIK